MNIIGGSINVRLGVWLDDIKQDVKQAMKTITPLQPEAVGLDAFSAELSPRTLGQSARRDLAHFVRAKGSALAALRADVGGRRLADPNTLDVNISRIKDALQLAADVGVGNLVVPAGYVPARDDKENQRLRATLSEATRALALLAASSSARLCWQGGNEPPDVLAEFLKSNDASEIIAVDLNPGGYVMRGIDPAKALNALQSRVTLCTAVDHYHGGAEAPFGQGDVRWGEVLIGLSTLHRAVPIDVLVGCALEGDRLKLLGQGYKRLTVLRQNPLA